MSGVCVWFTGLPCAGKTTLASRLSEHLTSQGERVVVLDGDQVRASVSADLGFSREHRHANVLRVARIARDAADSGATAICALVSPYAQSREEARQVVGAERFIEVYVNTPLEVCESRDAKGLYKLARSGQVEHFTGVSDPYEPPETPDVAITGVGDAAELIRPILHAIRQAIGIAGDQTGGRLDLETAERLAQLALDCIHREYPNKIGHHVLSSDRDAKPPRELTPAFYGCYDWHSAVHGHWMLARLARLFPESPLAERVKTALGRNLTAGNLRREAGYLAAPGRASFERPYGLAWLLQLAVELAAWDDPSARDWSAALEPLVDAAVARLEDWLAKLPRPVRSGEHSQTAFSLGLMLDFAAARGRDEFRTLLESKVRAFYLADRNAPLDYEPSGEDFLSPCLGEADVMRRVVDAEKFAEWLSGFLPQIPCDGSGWLGLASPADRSDPKLTHLDGLNLSRAWMLEGIAARLPEGDARIASLKSAAEEHGRAGMEAVTGEHYVGAHWLGTFAVYWMTAWA